ERGLIVLYQHFGRLEPGIIVGCHFKSIGAGIIKYKVVIFAYLSNHPVFSKSICFTNVAYYSIPVWCSRSIGYIFYMMIRSIKHWPDQMIEPAVHSDETGVTRLL